MEIVFDAQGNVLYTDPERFYQGSNLANVIGVTAPWASATQVTIAFTLPNGINLEEALMTNTGEVEPGKDVYRWTYTVPSAVTEYVGRVAFQVFAYNAANQRIATGSGGAIVEVGVPTQLPPTPSQDIYEQILTELSKINETAENLTQPPDVTDANNVGVVNVSITADGRFKFDNLKGQTGATGAPGTPGTDGKDGKDGKDGAPGSMVHIPITLDMWQLSQAPYTITITPEQHGLGNVPYLMVIELPKVSPSGDVAYYPAYNDHVISDDGTIQLMTNKKWEGLLLVGGGLSDIAIPYNQYTESTTGTYSCDYINSIATQIAEKAEKTYVDSELATKQPSGDYILTNEVDSKIATAINAVVENAPEAFDTLKEIADWIENDETGTAALVQRVGTAETEISNIKNGTTTVGSATKAAQDVSGNVIPDTYATKSELTSGLAAKQPAGDYATNTALTQGLAGKQPTGDYATNTALTQGLATKAPLQVKHAKNVTIGNSYATKSLLADAADANNYKGKYCFVRATATLSNAPSGQPAARTVTTVLYFPDVATGVSAGAVKASETTNTAATMFIQYNADGTYSAWYTAQGVASAVVNEIVTLF